MTVRSGAPTSSASALDPVVPASPTPPQALLLRALTLPPDRAVQAWERWAATVAVDDLEPDSQWLLPLLFVRLREAGVPAPAIERYANVFRHNWYTTHVRMRALGPVVAAVRAHGHEPVLVGAASLAVTAYAVVGSRPFASMTLAVPSGVTAEGLRAAERCLSDEVGVAIRWQAADRPAATRRATVAGLTLTVPDAPVALLEVFVDAARRSRDGELSSLLWALDAVTVGRALDRTGWDTVWRLAAERGLVAHVQLCVEWLRAEGMPVDGPIAA